MVKLGIGLIPSKKSLNLISEFSKLITDKNLIDVKTNNKNTPHMTLFQGNFDESEEVLKVMETLNFYNLKNQSIDCVTKWGKWIFLRFKKQENLKKMHNKIIEGLILLRKGKAIDFLDEEYMTQGQIRSFKETGYQFSKEEFMPHITLFSLSNYGKDIRNELLILDNFLLEVHLDVIEFEKIVVYLVGEEGSCSDIIFEREISC